MKAISVLILALVLAHVQASPTSTNKETKNQSLNGSRILEDKSALNPTCGWTQVFRDLQGSGPGDEFAGGPAFSKDGTTIAVGGRRNDGPFGLQEDIGQVRVYIRVENDLVLLGNPLYGKSSGDNFGVSVSLSDDGRTLAVGAFLSDDARGRAFVYRYLESIQDWQQIGNDFIPNTGNALLGGSVSLSGDGTIVAMGAALANIFEGQVYVFRLETVNEANAGPNITNGTIAMGEEWRPMGQVLTGIRRNIFFGFSVSLSRGDGTTVAVGVWGRSAETSGSGQVIVYRFNNESSVWEQLGRPIDGLEIENGHMGGTVVLSRDGAIVAAGASGDVDLAAIRGYVQVFAFDGNDWVQTGQNIVGESSGDRAGAGVALSDDGRILAVGSTFHDGENGVDSGHVRVFLYANDVNRWVQIGTDIEGVAANDQFGRRIALVEEDGNGGVIQIAIGSHLNDANGTDSGHVRWLTITPECLAAWIDSPLITTTPTVSPSLSPTIDASSCEWVQMGDTLDGQGVNDNFGGTVLLSGNGKMMAVGGLAPNILFENGEQTSTLPGVVRVYSLIDGNTADSQIGSDIIGDGVFDRAGDVFDFSYDGRTLAIGAPRSNDFLGRVRVFRLSESSDQWTQLGPDFLSSGSDFSGNYGESVALSSDGKVLAIGEPFFLRDDIPGGRVQVFRLSQDEWQQIGEDIFGTDLNDEIALSDPRFGASIALSDDGSLIAIGAFKSDIGGESSGRVHVYQFSSTDGWNRFGNAIDGRDELGGFGYQLSASADGLIIATASRPQSGSNLGTVTVFSYNSSHWQQLGEEITGEGAGGISLVESGLAISLSSDGLAVVVGAPGASGQAGIVRLYRFQPTAGDWVPIGREILGDEAGDQFGVSVSLLVMSPRTLVAIGGRFNDRSGIDSGHVKVFSILSSCIAEEVEFVASEHLFGMVSVFFVGIEEELDSTEKTVFEEVSSEWFDKYFLDSVPAVTSMVSDFSLQQQALIQLSHNTTVSGLTLIYAQRLSYSISSNSNATAEDIAVLPFSDVEATMEYKRLLQSQSAVFDGIQLPIELPIISPPVEPSAIGSESGSTLSNGIISGIVIGAFAVVLTTAFAMFRVYKANLPVAVGELFVENPTDSATPIAYPVSADPEPTPRSNHDIIESPAVFQNDSAPKLGPHFKDQMRFSAGNDCSPILRTRKFQEKGGPDYKDQVRADRIRPTKPMADENPSAGHRSSSRHYSKSPQPSSNDPRLSGIDGPDRSTASASPSNRLPLPEIPEESNLPEIPEESNSLSLPSSQAVSEMVDGSLHEEQAVSRHPEEPLESGLVSAPESTELPAREPRDPSGIFYHDLPPSKGP